jgi:hypothetical protein
MEPQGLLQQPSEADDTMKDPTNNLTLDSSMAKPVKHRPTFTEDQIAAMEKIFEQRQYLSPMERESLSNSVGLTPQQVRVWFQNRRQKVKQFLTQKQNGQQQQQSPRGVPIVVNGQKQQGNATNDDQQWTLTLLGGGGANETLSLTPQQLSTSIDPILQLLLPKAASTTENGNEDREEKRNEESNEDQTDDTFADDPNSGEEGLTTPNSNNIMPQALLYLTPYLLPGAGGNVAATSTNLTLPTNAIQLLQGLSSSQSLQIPLNKFAKVITQLPNKTTPTGSSPLLKAQSPTPVGEIEGSEIKSEELSMITDVDNTAELIPNQDGENADRNDNTKSDGNPPLLTAAASNELLQQLLNVTNESLKGSNWGGAGSRGGVSPATPTDGSSRRRRQVFSGIQTTELEKQFEVCPYIDSKERDKLAEKIGLHPDQVKVWFQNRRTKKSRISWRQKEPSEQ